MDFPESGGTSIFHPAGTLVVPTSLLDIERVCMRNLVQARALSQIYYEAALLLWIRVRTFYRCCEHCPLHRFCAEGVLVQHLTVALHLAIRYLGPQELVFTAATLRCAQYYWPGASVAEICDAELKMCRLLNWSFFPAPSPAPNSVEHLPLYTTQQADRLKYTYTP